MVEAIVYIAFCLLTGLFGSQRRLGFVGTFIASLVTTPLVVLPVLVLTAPRRVDWQQRPVKRA